MSPLRPTVDDRLWSVANINSRARCVSPPWLAPTYFSKIASAEAVMLLQQLVPQASVPCSS